MPPRIPTRDYQVGIPDAQLAPYQSVEGAGALGRQIGASLSDIGNAAFEYQSRQDLVDAHLARIERNQTLQQNLANAGLAIANTKLDAINSPDPEATFANGIDALQKQWREQYGDDEEFNQRATLAARSNAVDVRAAAIRQREQTAVGRFGNTIDTLLRTGGMSGSDAEREANIQHAYGVIDQAVADGVIRADQGDAQKQRYRSNLEELTLRRIGELNPDAALAALRAGRFDSIDADKRQGFGEHYQRASEADARQRQADLEHQRAIEERDAAKANAWDAVDLEHKIKAGGAGLKEIEAARSANKLTPAQYDGLKTTWDAVNRVRLKQAAEATRVAAAVGGGAALNPKSKDDREAVDAWFSEQAQGMQPDDLQRLIITTATKTGIIPPTVIGQLNGAARGSPERMAWASGTFQTLDQQAPSTLDDLPDETKRPLRMMAQYTNAGYGPADAQRRVLADLQVTDTVKTEREKFVREGGQSSPSEAAWTWFQTGADGAARSDQTFWERGKQGLDDADLALPVKAAFQRDYANAYRLTGNDQAARLEAADSIKKRWWVTDTDGSRRWMQYAPELVYGSRDRSSSEWLGQQLVDQTAAVAGFAADKLRGTLTIISDPLTARAASAGIPPTYAVWRRADSGVMEPVLASDGSAFRFQPVPPKPGEAHAAEVKRAEGKNARLRDTAPVDRVKELSGGENYSLMPESPE